MSKSDIISMIKAKTAKLSEETKLKYFSIVFADYYCNDKLKNGLIADKVFEFDKEFGIYKAKHQQQYYDNTRGLLIDVLYCKMPENSDDGNFAFIRNRGAEENDKYHTLYDITEFPFLGIYSEPDKILKRRCTDFIDPFDMKRHIANQDSDEEFWGSVFSSLENCMAYKPLNMDDLTKGKSNDKNLIYETINKLKVSYRINSKVNLNSLFNNSRKVISVENVKIGDIVYNYLKLYKLKDLSSINVSNIKKITRDNACGKSSVALNIDDAFLIMIPPENVEDLKMYITQSKKGLVIFANGFDPTYGNSMLAADTYVLAKLAEISAVASGFTDGSDKIKRSTAYSEFITYIGGKCYKDIAEVHNNSTLYYDFGNYWGDIDDQFISRIGLDNVIYADGSYSASTAGNATGFNIRKNGGNLAGADIIEKIKKQAIDVDKNTPIDVVCHSMGFAYALGIIETLQKEGYKIGYFYCIAPENPADGYIPKNIEGIWQYGSDEHNTEFWSQDLIAPQSPIGNNLGKDRRVFIPNEDIAKWDGGKNGWLNAHSIANYGWIFKREPKKGGYVTPR